MLILQRRVGIGSPLQLPSIKPTWLADAASRFCGPTSKPTDRRYLTDKTAPTPRNVPGARTAVRCSAIVRHRVSHTSESNSGKLEKPCHAPTTRKSATPHLSLSKRRNSSGNEPRQLASGLSPNPRQ